MACMNVSAAKVAPFAKGTSLRTRTAPKAVAASPKLAVTASLKQQMAATLAAGSLLASAAAPALAYSILDDLSGAMDTTAAPAPKAAAAATTAPAAKAAPAPEATVSADKVAAAQALKAELAAELGIQTEKKAAKNFSAPKEPKVKAAPGEKPVKAEKTKVSKPKAETEYKEKQMSPLLVPIIVLFTVPLAATAYSVKSIAGLLSGGSFSRD